MCEHHHKKQARHGSALEHGKAHNNEHKNWSRRDFLRGLGMAGGTSLVLGNTPLTALGASPLNWALSNSDNDRVLVMIRLKGGNDGLNTIIPLYEYDAYAQARPTVRVAENEAIKLSDEVGMHASMQDLESLWGDGAMKVLHSVGYADQNLSHFRSSDIWASGSDANTSDRSGWLGRYLGDIYPDYLTNPPETPPAIQIGGFGTLTFNNSDLTSIAVSVSEPEVLQEIAETGQLYDLNNLPDCGFGEQLGYVRSIANSTFFYAESISEASERGNNAVEYPAGNPLSEQLATVARLIKGNLGTKLYMVNLNGFDTHAEQADSHALLLLQLSSAINAFYRDLGAGGWSDKVLSTTFSEFGRRVEENGSFGTDHGAAAPLLFFGEALNGNGFAGTQASLTDLDEDGNLKHHTDFRQVYATLLEQWLCVDTVTVDQALGRSYERLDLGFACGEVQTSTQQFAASANDSIRHYTSSDGVYQTIHYTIPTTDKVRVELFNVLGQHLTTVDRGARWVGKHEARFDPQQCGLGNGGAYFYRIHHGDRTVVSGLQVVR